MATEHTPWCNVHEHNTDPEVGCFSRVSTRGGISSWLVDDTIGRGVIVLAQNGRLNAQELRTVIEQLQQYEAELMKTA